jgi:hypothetical protein
LAISIQMKDFLSHILAGISSTWSYHRTTHHLVGQN